MHPGTFTFLQNDDERIQLIRFGNECSMWENQQVNVRKYIYESRPLVVEDTLLVSFFHILCTRIILVIICGFFSLFWPTCTRLNINQSTNSAAAREHPDATAPWRLLTARLGTRLSASRTKEDGTREVRWLRLRVCSRDARSARLYASGYSYADTNGLFVRT